MDRLLSMRAFCKVVSAGSFARAAEGLALNNAAVSRLVADLERHLGARLLNRTTRSFSLTEAGQDYLARCQRILEEIDEAEALVTDQPGHATGRLRMLASVSVGLQLLMPHLLEFRRLHPEVSLDLHLAERSVDLVNEGFDLAIQPKQFVGSNSVVARSLFTSQAILCASPEYLRQRGTPTSVAELSQHDCLSYAHDIVRDRWRLRRNGEEETVEVPAILLSNNAEALLVAARSGLGIGLALDRLITADIKTGNLIRVLPEYWIEELEFFLVYPSRKFLPIKVKAMVDFLLTKSLAYE